MHNTIPDLRHSYPIGVYWDGCSLLISSCGGRLGPGTRSRSSVLGLLCGWPTCCVCSFGGIAPRTRRAPMRDCARLHPKGIGVQVGHREASDAPDWVAAGIHQPRRPRGVKILDESAHSSPACRATGELFAPPRCDSSITDPRGASTPLPAPPAEVRASRLTFPQDRDIWVTLFRLGHFDLGDSWAP